MKNSKSIIAIIVLAILATAVAIVSCKKEKQEQASINSEQNAPCFDNMDEYLISFKNRLLSAKKGEETISLEQAQRDLGNLLNFDFGDANYPSNVFQYDTINTQLVVSDGIVDLSQLAITYKDAYNQIAKAYELVNLPEKSVYTIACSVQHNGDVELLLTTRGMVLCSKDMEQVTINPNKMSFDTTDCWTVFFGRGRCDGTDMGYDHTSVLQLVYHNKLGLYYCLDGNVYYTDVTQETIDALDYSETGTPQYNQGYRLWVGDYMEFHYGTVPYPEMVYYYNNLDNIINYNMDLLNDDEYRIINISNTILRNENNLSQFRFLCKYQYGKPHCSGGSNK